MLVLKNYQEKAVEDVIKITERFFEADKGQKICYLQAPTGSGKTIIAQAFIDRIQSKYPEFNKLKDDLISINSNLIKYRQKMKELVIGLPKVEKNKINKKPSLSN